MALNNFKTLYHAVTDENEATDNSLEEFGHERMIFVAGNIGLIKDTDGEVIKQQWWTNSSFYPLPERNLDELKTFIDSELVKNPDAKWGILNLEAPHLNIINNLSGNNIPLVSESVRNRVIKAFQDIFEMLKAEYPQIKWSNYNSPFRHYWTVVNRGKDWQNLIEGHYYQRSEAFAPIADLLDWYAPASYDAYNYDAALNQALNRDQEKIYCISGHDLMRYYQAVTNTSKPVINVLYHAYRNNGRYSSDLIEPNPSITQTPFPTYTQDSHGGSGERGMYLGKPIATEEWMSEWGRPSVDAQYDGIYMWHWNRGFFNYCFSSLTAPQNETPQALETYNQVLFHRARMRWWMSLENDFGFTPYSAPSPTSHSLWTSGSSSTEIRQNMRLYFKLVMKKKMDDIRNYALSINPPLYKPNVANEQFLTLNPVTNLPEDTSLINQIDSLIDQEGLV